MNNNVLITQEELLKEKFNSQEIINTENIAEFLLYFARILQLGVMEELIGGDEFNFISNMLTKAISNCIIIPEDDEFVDDSEQIANYMYVITLYLQSKSNWEAFLELKDLTSIEKAQTFVAEVKSWILKKLTAQILILETNKQNVQKLNMQNVTSCYNSLRKVLNNFMHFDNVSFTFHLKLYHKSSFQPVEYSFLKTDFDYLPNFYEKLSKMISYFILEVSIMAKLNVKSLVNGKLDEAKEISDLMQSKSEVLNKEYEEKINNLRKEYETDLQCYYDSLHRPGRKKKGLKDDVLITRKYVEKKKAIESKLERKFSLLLEEQQTQDNNMIPILDENYSLIDLIKEYALFGLAQKGIFNYPSNAEARGQMLMAINLDVAISEFISMNKTILTNEQINYLLDAI